MATKELYPLMDEIEEGLRDIWESALTARSAAQEVLDKKQKLSMRITKMRIEIAEQEYAEAVKG